MLYLDPVHTGPDLYGHHINLKSLKTSMTLKFVIILQNYIKAYHRKSGKSKYDRKLTELDVETTRIRSLVNVVLIIVFNMRSWDIFQRHGLDNRTWAFQIKYH